MRHVLSSRGGIGGLLFFGALVAGIASPRSAAAQTLSGPAQTDLTLTTYAKGLSKPTDIAILPDGRAIVTQKDGDVALVLGAGKAATTAGHLTVDNDSEKGLLGVVADPGFATNHFVYFYADIGATLDDRHHVVRYVVGDDGMISSPKVILGAGAPTPGIRGPANHDGGGLIIYKNQLYISVGDTGANTNIPSNKFGSCLNQANGKILRINLDGTVPADNPLFNVAMATACDSVNGAFTLAPPDKRIFAWGLRNPWRFWIDPSGAAAGTLWIGDVGEATREEISVGKGDQHYGYPFEEGTRKYTSQEQSFQPAGTCMGMTPARPCTPPVHDYDHSNGNNCVIGGLIIDGCGWPAAWKNRYIFGDNGSGNIWMLEVNATRTGVSGNPTLIGKMGGPASFRMGPDSALYIVENGAGAVERLTPKTPVAGDCPLPDAGAPNTGKNDAGAGGGSSDASTGGTGGGSPMAGAGGNSGQAGASQQGAGGEPPEQGGAGNDGSAGAKSLAAPAASDSGGCGCRSAAAGPMGAGAAFVMLSGIAIGLVRRRLRGAERRRR